MEIPGVCSICGRVAAPAYSCILCGRVVCSRDFRPEKGICKKCTFREMG